MIQRKEVVFVLNYANFLVASFEMIKTNKNRERFETYTSTRAVCEQHSILKQSKIIYRFIVSILIFHHRYFYLYGF